MHLAIPGDVGYFYHLQMALTAAKHDSRATAYLSKSFHRDVIIWKSLCADMGSRPTYLVNFSNASLLTWATPKPRV